MSGKLEGKVAVVTGGNSGIGLATAKRFVAEGAYVFITGRRQAELDAAVKEIGENVTGIQGDVAKFADLDRLYAAVKAKKGRIDILFANAGISKFAPLESLAVKDFDDLFAVNVRAPYFLVQQLLPALGDGSSVILVSSLGAHAAVGTLSAYAATKGAIDTLVKYFAAALGPRGIRVNAVAPGVIDTDMSSFAKTDEGKTFVLGMQALKRIGQPGDVGPVVAFLASDDARWITGDTIRVDGGSKL